MAAHREPAPGAKASGEALSWAVVAAVAAGGALGTLGRYQLEQAWPAVSGRLPWATLSVNVSGSLLLGALAVLLAGWAPQGLAPRLAGPFVGTGLLGSWTTMSAFAVQTHELARAGRWAAAALYVGATVAAGTAAAALGVLGARRLPAGNPG
jgi:fluoride exporter